MASSDDNTRRLLQALTRACVHQYGALILVAEALPYAKRKDYWDSMSAVSESLNEALDILGEPK